MRTQGAISVIIFLRHLIIYRSATNRMFFIDFSYCVFTPCSELPFFICTMYPWNFNIPVSEYRFVISPLTLSEWMHSLDILAAINLDKDYFTNLGDILDGNISLGNITLLLVAVNKRHTLIGCSESVQHFCFPTSWSKSSNEMFVDIFNISALFCFIHLTYFH